MIDLGQRKDAVSIKPISFLGSPLFIAYVSTEIPNVTGGGQEYTIVFDAEAVDRGTAFDTSTGIFTAPIAGYYLFTYTVELQGLSAASHTGGIAMELRSNEVTPSTQNLIYFDSGGAPTGEVAANGAKIVFLGAGKTVEIIATVGGSAQTVDIGTLSNFQGFLLTK